MQPVIAWVRDRPGAGPAALLLLALLLAAMVSVVNPIFEATDELRHYRFARYLADEWALPVQPTNTRTQYHQPPLYYLGGALASAVVEDPQEIPPINPHWISYRSGDVHADNKNLYIPTAAGAFPWYGTALSVHLIRFWSVALAAGTLFLLGKLAFALWPEERASRWLFIALAGLNPMFLYISGSVNNDNLVILLGTLMLWLCVQGVRQGFPWRLTAFAGLVWGLAMLAKLTGLLLAVPWGVALLWVAWERRSWRFLLGRAALITALGALLAGWWFARNVALYGDLFGLEPMYQIWGRREWAIGLYELYENLLYSWQSFWGRFGFGQIVLPRPLYWFYSIVAALGIGGVLVQLGRVLRRRDRSPETGIWLVLLATVAVHVAGLIYYITRSPTGSNGRYVFPALAAIAAGLVWGLNVYGRPRWLRPLLAVALVAATLFSVGWLLPWTYAPPATVSEADLAAWVDERHPYRWGEGIRLLGTRIEPYLQPGEREAEVVVTTCWQTDAPLHQNYTFFMHLLDRDLNILGARNTHTGLGHFPTALWEPGKIYCEAYHMPVEREALAAPQTGLIDVGFFNQDPNARLPVTPAGDPATGLVIIGEVEIPPPAGAAGPGE